MPARDSIRIAKPEPAAPRAPSPVRRLFAALFFVALPVALVDQFTKSYIMDHLQMGQTIPVIPHFFDITYVQNPGAAFSLFTNLPPGTRIALLLGASVIAIVVILFLLASTARPVGTTIAFGLLLGGAAGNLIDRLIRGRVVDFILVHYYEHNYPVFNVADSAITIGVLFILLGAAYTPRT